MIFNWENNKHNNQTQETMNTVFILGEAINGKNPTTFSEIESAPNVEPKTVSDVLTAVTFFLSSPSVFSFLNYVLHLSVDECVINRDSSSLFILIPTWLKPY